MKIIGISGRKQSGKNTMANILHGIVLKQKGMIKDFNIDGDGKLIVLTTNSDNQEGWGEFDVARNDTAFINYAEHNMWPYVKLYSFADHLKWICIKLFNIPHECVFGTDEQKNQLQSHLLWEKMPCLEIFNNPKRKGPMTAREFMQFFGTNICRGIYEPIWMQSCLNTIKKEQSELAVISDVRFENEVRAIEEAGGKVVRLTRITTSDTHDSEKALDNYPFSDYLDNSNNSIDSMMVKVKQFYQSL